MVLCTVRSSSFLVGRFLDPICFERACARVVDLDGPVAVYSRHLRSGFHAAHLAAERDLELLTVRSILYHTRAKLGLQLLHLSAFGCRAPSALRASLLAHSSLGTSSSVGTPSRLGEGPGAASNFHRPGTVCKRRSGCNGRSSTHAATRRPFGPYLYTFFKIPLPPPNFQVRTIL